MANRRLEGEGGGQILRSSLALALVTGNSVRISNIRAGRTRHGLMRQHLAAVRAAASISGAELVGDAIGSTTIELRPARVRAGDYTFSTGGAGSTTLVFPDAWSFAALPHPDRAARAAVAGTLHGDGRKRRRGSDRVHDTRSSHLKWPRDETWVATPRSLE